MLISQWNEQLFHWINQLGGNPGLARALDWFGTPILGLPTGVFDMVAIVALMALVFIYYDGVPGWRASHSTWRDVFGIGFSGFLAWVSAHILKLIFAIPRPYEVLENINTIFVFGGGDSYPSGHATFFMAIAIATYYSHRRLGYVYVGIAVVIGLSRIVAGVHYPVDVMAGWLLGYGIILLIVAGKELLPVKRAPWQPKLQ